MSNTNQPNEVRDGTPGIHDPERDFLVRVPGKRHERMKCADLNCEQDRLQIIRDRYCGQSGDGPTYYEEQDFAWLINEVELLRARADIATRSVA